MAKRTAKEWALRLAPLAAIAGLDMERGLLYFRGNVARYRNILEEFTQRHAPDFGLLLIAVQTRNHEALHRSAVDRSPLHYDSLRLHRIVLPDGGPPSRPASEPMIVVFFW